MQMGNSSFGTSTKSLPRLRAMKLMLYCLLTGYNYDILNQCSEASHKKVKKYFSALVIVIAIWFIIGFTFYQRYLHGDTFSSLSAGLIMATTVIMIERQIILTVGSKKLTAFFRFFIGLIMALIGAVIVDQVMLKDDIESIKIEQRLQKVEQLLPNRTRELDTQISQLDAQIKAKEKEREEVITEVSQKPYISLPSYQKSTITDSEQNVSETIARGMTSIPNPKYGMIEKTDSLILSLQSQKLNLENKRASARQTLEAEIKQQTGFLEDFKILKDVIFSSWYTVIIYGLFFLFLLSIELLIVFINSFDSETDYDTIVKHQLDTRVTLIQNIGSLKKNGTRVNEYSFQQKV